MGCAVKRRRWNRALVTGLLAVTAAGCVDTFLGPAPEADHAVMAFDALWTEFDRHYAFFGHKGMDWDAMRAEYRPRIEDGATDGELFDVVADMLDELEDGHVNFFTPYASYSYEGWREPYPESFNLPMMTARLYNPRATSDHQLVWGARHEFGYIWVGDFTSDRSSQLERAVRELRNKSGLIIDVRNNGGGSGETVRDFAGLFADRRVHYMDIRYRNGPEHDDFSAPAARYVEPRSARFDGPVAILTNRRAFSAAEGLVLAARQMPDATVIGDTTGGGAGSTIVRELPNGWLVRLSHSIGTDPVGRTWEGVGLAPDRWVVQTEGDVAAGRAPVLDAAVEVLRAQVDGGG